MSGTGMLVVQEAVFARLNGDATLLALISGVFDGAPSSQAKPYIDIGDGDEAPFMTFGSNDGHDNFVDIHIWTEDGGAKVGYKAGMQILERVNVLLHGYALPVSGHSTVLCQFDHAAKARNEADGVVTREIWAAYRVITQ